MVRSIRWRLQLWYAAVLLAVVGGLTVAVYLQARQSRLGQIDDRLIAAANFLDAMLRGIPGHELDGTAPPPRFNDDPPPRMPPFGKGFGKANQPPLPLEARGASGDGGDPADFVIWRADGGVYRASALSAAVPRPDISHDLLPVNGEAYCVSRGWRREALALGPRGTLIRVGRSIERELTDLQRLAWQLALGGGVAMLVGLAGGWWVSSRIIRPVAKIAATAEAISANNLSQRIDPRELDIELTGLAGVLNATFARLEESFSRQVRFTADASHELRTPLAVVSAHVESALACPRTVEEYRDALCQVRRAADRMKALVEGLLMLARADAGRLEVDHRPVDLRTVVEEAVDQFLPAAGKAGVALVSRLPDAPVRVTGETTFLVRIAENLIDNALRHTPTGGRVTAAVSVEKTRAVLRVTDTGAGIPEADQPKVFDRFYRADLARSRQSGGVGLGLAICKSLVEAHGGSIRFVSEPGRGTAFAVLLPIREGT